MKKFRIPLEKGFTYLTLEEIADRHAESLDFNTAQQYVGIGEREFEIYEGDIINVENNKAKLVDIEIYTWWHGQSLKVIGNIHDNPEMLEMINWAPNKFIFFLRDNPKYFI